MADIVFNGAKGRVNELVRRVKNNDPANSAIIVVALKATGLEADAVLRDYTDLAALLAAANDEATNVNYARKVLTDVELTAPTPDQVNDRQDADTPDLVWTAVADIGDAPGKGGVSTEAAREATQELVEEPAPEA